MTCLTQGSNTWLSRAGIHPHSPSGTLCGTLNGSRLLYSVLQFSIEDNSSFSPQWRAVPKRWEDTLVAQWWPHPTPASSGARILWSFPSFSLQQHGNATTDASQICWGPPGSRGVRREEPDQCARPPWKWQLKSKLYLFSLCANYISVLCVIFLLPATETHPASASKQRKLQRQQTLTKPCPKASPHHIIPTAICFANATN